MSCLDLQSIKAIDKYNSKAITCSANCWQLGVEDHGNDADQ